MDREPGCRDHALPTVLLLTMLAFGLIAVFHYFAIRRK
jgi:hypothetical protein